VTPPPDHNERDVLTALMPVRPLHEHPGDYDRQDQRWAQTVATGKAASRSFVRDARHEPRPRE
jgi:hypothetical protein